MAVDAQGQTAKMLVEGTKLEADFKKWTENPWRIGDAPGGIRGFAPRLDHHVHQK
jgi:hypothetical protein